MAKFYPFRSLLGLCFLTAAFGCSSESKPTTNIAPEAIEVPPVQNPEEAMQPVRALADQLRDARRLAIERGMPIGLKFIAVADSPWLADRTQLVEQSDSFAKGWLEGEKGKMFVTGRDKNGPLKFDDVEAEDLLELVREKNKLYRIVRVSDNRLELGEPLSFALTPSPSEPNFAIHRQPRKLANEKPVALSPGWVVDLTPPPPEGMGLTSQGIDYILFAPDGVALIPPPESAIVWVRNTKAEAAVNQEAIIVIRSTTGALSVHHVNRDPNVGNGNPLFHVKGLLGGEPKNAP